MGDAGPVPARRSRRGLRPAGRTSRRARPGATRPTPSRPGSRTISSGSARPSGMELEPTGQEVRVERFAADILARDPERRLGGPDREPARCDRPHPSGPDHDLPRAGLDARTVIWIAPEFREPHLSAVRWLNEHTAEGFSFFAVRLRVVRIEESPMAPVFEVVEKPNGWERRLSRWPASRPEWLASRATASKEFWANVAARGGPT